MWPQAKFSWENDLKPPNWRLTAHKPAQQRVDAHLMWCDRHCGCASHCTPGMNEASSPLAISGIVSAAHRPSLMPRTVSMGLEAEGQHLFQK